MLLIKLLTEYKYTKLSLFISPISLERLFAFGFIFNDSSKYAHISYSTSLELSADFVELIENQGYKSTEELNF